MAETARMGTDAEQRMNDAVLGNTHGKNKWAILFTVLVMTFMSTLDSSIVNVALPVMRAALGVGLDQIQWVASIYLVMVCAAMLVFGRLGDMFGKVYLFQAGVVVFTVGSLMCGLAHTFEALMVSRAVQGIGAAGAMANNMGIITESFPARERGRALGLLASFVALGMMCGPVLGGFIVAALPWECIFLINVPVGVLSFLAGLKTLPHVRPDRSGLTFDVAGSLLLAPGLVLVLCSITLIESGFSWVLAAALALGAVLLVAFVAVERACAQPLVQLSVFSNPVFDISILTGLVSFVAVGGTEIILPFYFQDACGFAPAVAGLLFAVIPLVNAVVGPLSGTVSDRIGAHAPTTIGLGIYAVGIAAVGLLTQESSPSGSWASWRSCRSAPRCSSRPTTRSSWVRPRRRPWGSWGASRCSRRTPAWRSASRAAWRSSTGR